MLFTDNLTGVSLTVWLMSDADRSLYNTRDYLGDRNPFITGIRDKNVLSGQLE